MTTFAADGSVVAPPSTNGHVPDAEPQRGLRTDSDNEVKPFPTDVTPAPAPVAAEPEPEPEPHAEPSTEATADDDTQNEPTAPTLDAGWPHDWLQFHGDKLGVRIPASDAYAPVQIAEMGHTQPGLAQRLSVRFLEMHIAPQSYERVMERIMDPDEPDFTGKALGELVNVLSALNSAGDATE